MLGDVDADRARADIVGAATYTPARYGEAPPRHLVDALFASATTDRG